LSFPSKVYRNSQHDQDENNMMGKIDLSHDPTERVLQDNSNDQINNGIG